MFLCIVMFTFTTKFPVITHNQNVSSVKLNPKVASSSPLQSNIPSLPGKKHSSKAKSKCFHNFFITSRIIAKGGS